MPVFKTQLPIVAMTVGWVTVTGRWIERLTDAEKLAVLAHEQGHIYHAHALKRIWWLASFQWKNLLHKCKLQEFEADAFAVSLGHRAGLAQFLVRMAMPEGPLHPSCHDRIINIANMMDASEVMASKASDAGR